jgi:hypothetical protein
MYNVNKDDSKKKLNTKMAEEIKWQYYMISS